MHLRDFLEEKGYQRIPLKKLATGHYKLLAKINGKRGYFILDTGASTTCIGVKEIKRFSLKNEESEIKAAGAGTQEIETQLARENSLYIGNYVSKNVDVILLDLSHVNMALEKVDEVAVHGIIGADILKKGRAIIDYGRNALYIK